MDGTEERYQSHVTGRIYRVAHRCSSGVVLASVRGKAHSLTVKPTALATMFRRVSA